jgi:hypothetical protein
MTTTITPQTRYAVETSFMCHHWQNCWSIIIDGKEQPHTFPTREEAQAEIDRHKADIEEAVRMGDMESSDEDWRIVEVPSMTTTIDKTATIRELNDAFRRTGDGGRTIFTAGVSGEGVAFSHQTLALVRRFDTFTPDNDPHQEHDFGSLTHQGQKVFWKIDYYDAACEHGSEDPADPSQTTRVLTIMLAEEY